MALLPTTGLAGTQQAREINHRPSKVEITARVTSDWWISGEAHAGPRDRTEMPINCRLRAYISRDSNRTFSWVYELNVCMLVSIIFVSRPIWRWSRLGIASAQTDRFVGSRREQQLWLKLGVSAIILPMYHHWNSRWSWMIAWFRRNDSEATVGGSFIMTRDQSHRNHQATQRLLYIATNTNYTTSNHDISLLHAFDPVTVGLPYRNRCTNYHARWFKSLKYMVQLLVAYRYYLSCMHLWYRVAQPFRLRLGYCCAHLKLEQRCLLFICTPAMKEFLCVELKSYE